MQVNGTPYRCIWPEADRRSVAIIDQTKLPHCFASVSLRTLDDAVLAIRDMLVRGAPSSGPLPPTVSVSALMKIVLTLAWRPSAPP